MTRLAIHLSQLQRLLPRHTLSRRVSMETDARLESIASIVVDTAFHVHRELGPGLFESAYQAIMAHELALKGLNVEREYGVSFEYNGHLYRDMYRVDLFVEKCLIVEVKAVNAFAPIHEKQILSYMRLLKIPLGLLFNFNELLIKNGIKRFRL